MQSNNSIFVTRLEFTTLLHVTGMDQVQFLWFLELNTGPNWYALLKCKHEIKVVVLSENKSN